MESLNENTKDEYKDRYYKEKEEIENREMWLEVALLAEKGLPFPKTKGADKEKKQLALEHAILKHDEMIKERNEKLSESNQPNQESGQSE